MKRVLNMVVLGVAIGSAFVGHTDMAVAGIAIYMFGNMEV